ncbi:DNA cytosine methyltransferase [Mammaliicoccus sciuri]|uniref:DNA cytosine methyltransferase n=1 Tax=Mammaliicoccus sciuri TaxID=1296 RepID=UPI001FB21546|nr:DNA cytosine methyltransferase [Mammaliicoccus sciuri]MCJ0919610.1 DNA cytosine methyltransferase [Mammaliicoccus sciuri]MCJ0962612.1 DNA cytosine methyltransferase [Mammaliicoccus sciuri]MEB7051393.1 DNA cytosine methyltransferase [Mammaliicoccus sciuri]
MKLEFIDLFAGIGGMRLAFEDKNTKCVFSSEWDKYAQMTYETNFGVKPQGDITQIDEKDIPKHDILIGGFPCQPFSNIGKRQGFKHETQGNLFFEIMRILTYHQPPMFLLENVTGLLTNDNGKTFEIIKDSLDNANYNIFYDVLDSKDFGVPQVRKRIYIVGFHKGLNINDFSFPKSNGLGIKNANSILEKDPSGYSISKNLQDNYLFKKNDGRPQIIDENSEFPVKTLVSTYHKIQRLTGTFVKGGDTGLRLLSELECKRIMGFPDNFKIPVSRTQMYRQFGNSIAVPVVEAIANEMKKKYKEECKNYQLNLTI